MNYYFKLYLILFLLSCLSLQSCFGQFKTVYLKTAKELPIALKYKGNFKQAIRWYDKMGSNLVLITETGEYPSKNNGFDDFRDAELFAYHYLLKGDSIKHEWMVYDFVKECPVEIDANFINKTLQVTDLNQDGMGEIWLMYKVVCRGDVSPSEMKIIMYQGLKKFAMRGRNKVKVSENEYEGGEYRFDKSFLNGPKEFRFFAQKLWNSNLLEAL